MGWLIHGDPIWVGFMEAVKLGQNVSEVLSVVGLCLELCTILKCGIAWLTRLILCHEKRYGILSLEDYP